LRILNGSTAWFDRAYVKEKLDTEKYVACATEKLEDGLPSMEGLATVPPLKTEQFLWYGLAITARHVIHTQFAFFFFGYTGIR
jgi:hypothetical protein